MAFSSRSKKISKTAWPIVNAPIRRRHAISSKSHGQCSPANHWSALKNKPGHRVLRKPHEQVLCCSGRWFKLHNCHPQESMLVETPLLLTCLPTCRRNLSLTLHVSE